MHSLEISFRICVAFELSKWAFFLSTSLNHFVQNIAMSQPAHDFVFTRF